MESEKQTNPENPTAQAPIARVPVENYGALVPLAAIIERGGGVFVGIQPGAPELGIETLILFRHPFGSTLAVKLSQCTEELIRARIGDCTARFKGA